MDGRRAWTVAASAFLANVVVMGAIFSFGAFFDAMAEEFDAGHGATAVLFSLTTGVAYALGIVTGPASDRFGPRALAATGTVLITTGLLLTAAAQSLWVAYLTFSLLVGLGAGCIHIPLLATVGGWFERYRTAALAAAVSGNGIGALVATPAAAALIDAYGFRVAYVVFGIVAAIVLTACTMLTARGPRAAAQCAAGCGWRESVRAVVHAPGFSRFYLSGVTGSMAVFTAIVLIAPYAREAGAGPVAAATFVGVIGAASVAGRFAMILWTARRDLLATYRLTVLGVCASLVILLPSGGNIVAIGAFALAFGVTYGGYASLTPPVVARIVGPERLGAALGAAYTAVAIGSFLGPPVAGAVVDVTGRYEPAIAMTLALIATTWVTLQPIGRVARLASEPVVAAQPQAV